MSRATIHNGGMIRCEHPGCAERFITFSVATMARQQAQGAGWVRVLASSVRVGNKPLGTGRQMVDLCPTHKPRPRMEGAQP